MRPLAPGFIASSKIIPLEIFRVNKGPTISLREWAQFPVQRSKIFDIHTYAGRVLPNFTKDKSVYRAPNGASMRPNGWYQQTLVRRLKGSGWIVYSVPKGTRLPEDLILVHERGDHYSMQPAVEMSLEDLNQRISKFLQSSATVYTLEQWCSTYKLSSGKTRGWNSTMDTETFIG